MVVKGKHTGRPRKTSNRQERKLKVICLKIEDEKMKNKREDKEVNV